MLASLTRKSCRLDDEAVGRDQIARRKKDEITGHDRADGHRLLHPVPHHAAHQREASLQLLDRRGRPVFLKEAEQRAAEDDRQNDGGVHPLLQHQRDRGSESQDEDERALELAQKEAKRAEAWCIFNAVGADKGKLCRGSIGRQPARARLQSCGQRGWHPGSSREGHRLPYSFTVPISSRRFRRPSRRSLRCPQSTPSPTRPRR